MINEADARQNRLDRERKDNEEHVRRRNAQLQHEVPGYVRTTGSRRQYKLSINGRGEIVQTEL